MQHTAEESRIIASVIKKELSSLGSMEWREWITLVHFVALAVLWLSRSPGGVAGWGQIFSDGLVSPFSQSSNCPRNALIYCDVYPRPSIILITVQV